MLFKKRKILDTVQSFVSWQQVLRAGPQRPVWLLARLPLNHLLLANMQSQRLLRQISQKFDTNSSQAFIFDDNALFHLWRTFQWNQWQRWQLVGHLSLRLPSAHCLSFCLFGELQCPKEKKIQKQDHQQPNNFWTFAQVTVLILKAIKLKRDNSIFSDPLNVIVLTLTLAQDKTAKTKKDYLWVRYWVRECVFSNQV